MGSNYKNSINLCNLFMLFSPIITPCSWTVSHRTDGVSILKSIIITSPFISTLPPSVSQYWGFQSCYQYHNFSLGMILFVIRNVVQIKMNYYIGYAAIYLLKKAEIFCDKKRLTSFISNGQKRYFYLAWAMSLVVNMYQYMQ